MTTLKTYCADEIALALDAQLRDESFVGMYKKAAPANWWDQGPTAKAFKAEVDGAQTPQEVDAIQDKYLGGGEFTSALGREGIEDHTPLRNYADMAAGKKTLAADDKCPAAKDGCPECADAGLAVAVDFAIRHVVKVADALDKAGFTGVAETLDETLRKLASRRPITILAEKKKKARGRSYKEWVSFLNKQSEKAGAKFSKTYKGALEHAKGKKGLKGSKAEEYAVRTALDGVDKKYLKEPGPEHGSGKSGPLTTKR